MMDKKVDRSFGTATLSGLEFVRARGALEHNLKNVDVVIPRESLVVFTGVSGSGKSSLAFGTLYAEAQRRYLESVSPYARRLFHQMAVPEVDEVGGLPPAVALQHFCTNNRRISRTCATATVRPPGYWDVNVRQHKLG